MIIIFCDTNIIFWLFKRICDNQKIENSALAYISKNNKIYISDFIIKEIKENFEEKYNIYISDENIQKFLEITWFEVMRSNRIHPEIIRYINDFDDAQILQDAIDINADILLTKNTKDFNIRWIYEKRNIKITDSIPKELFE